MTKGKKFSTEVDQSIAKKIVYLRMSQGMTQVRLAEQIGVSSQQLQKYEKVVNRITIGRLALIANALGKPLQCFYNDIEEGGVIEIEETPQQKICNEISLNCMRLRNLDHQKLVNNLITTLINQKQAA